MGRRELVGADRKQSLGPVSRQALSGRFRLSHLSFPPPHSLRLSARSADCKPSRLSELLLHGRGDQDRRDRALDVVEGSAVRPGLPLALFHHQRRKDGGRGSRPPTSSSTRRSSRRFSCWSPFSRPRSRPPSRCSSSPRTLSEEGIVRAAARPLRAQAAVGKLKDDNPDIQAGINIVLRALEAPSHHTPRSTTSAASRNAGTDGCGPAVRGRQCHADPLQRPAQTQELGLRDRQAINDAQGAHRCGSPARPRPTSGGSCSRSAENYSLSTRLN